MTLMKSLLLGSAAGIVAVASAQAADLPTKKGAPAAEYVRICSITVNGAPIVGWTLPGSETCFKLSGYVTGQIEGGNLKDGEVLDYMEGTQRNNGVFETRPDFGWTTRLNVTGDAVSNTAYGPLLAHFEMQFENGNGFDNTGTGSYINLAYVTWAGLTAGKAQSFFSFTGGGAGWANFFSPDQKGFNQPDLLAYTASFGGGFSATVAAQSSGTNGNSGGGTNFSDLGSDYAYNGMRSPDWVAALKVSQGWGSAQISGVLHQVDVTGFDGTEVTTWGWGIDAGVSFNLPQFGVGDQILFTGAYTEHAAWYSGLPDGMWGENGAVNGNGQQMALADIYENPDGTWAKPQIWSVSGEFDHRFSPQFQGSLEASYGHVNWTGTDLTSVVSNSNSWLAGVVAHWQPLGTNALDFEFELLYQSTRTDQPNGFCPAPSCTTSGGIANTNWQGNADGFAARFEVTRNF